MRGAFRICQVVGQQAHIAANDAPVELDLLDNPAHEVHGNGETDALRTRVLGENGCIDTDELAEAVDERAARIPGVNRSVGLDKVGEGDKLVQVAACRAHDALCNRRGKTVGVADGEDDVADAQVIRTGHADWPQLGQIDLQKSQVRLGIEAHDLRFRDTPVGELDPDFGRLLLEYMVIRDQVALFVENDGRGEGRVDPETCLAGAFIGRLHQALGVDIRDRRGAAVDGIGIARRGSAVDADTGHEVRADQDHEERDGEADHDRLQDEDNCGLQFRHPISWQGLLCCCLAASQSRLATCIRRRGFRT